MVNFVFFLIPNYLYNRALYPSVQLQCLWQMDLLRMFCLLRSWHCCPQGLVVTIGAANFALSEVQADFLHRKGYNLMFILCVLIKAIGYLLCAVSVLSSFFYKLCIWVWKKCFRHWPCKLATHSWLLQLAAHTWLLQLATHTWLLQLAALSWPLQLAAWTMHGQLWAARLTMSSQLEWPTTHG